MPRFVHHPRGGGEERGEGVWDATSSRRRGRLRRERGRWIVLVHDSVLSSFHLLRLLGETCHSRVTQCPGIDCFFRHLPVERKNLISKHYTLRSKLEKWQLLDWGKLIWKWRTTFRNNLQNTSPILHTSHFPPFCLSHFLLKSVTLFRLMTTMIDLVLNTREDKLSTCQNPKQGTYLSSSTTTSVRYPNGH